MNQARLDEILLQIKHKLEDKFGEEVEVYEEKGFIVREASKPNAPVIPEEIGILIREAVGDLDYNYTDWPIMINPKNGNLVIRYTPTNSE